MTYRDKIRQIIQGKFTEYTEIHYDRNYIIILHYISYDKVIQLYKGRVQKLKKKIFGIFQIGSDPPPSPPLFGKKNKKNGLKTL